MFLPAVYPGQTIQNAPHEAGHSQKEKETKQ